MSQTRLSQLNEDEEVIFREVEEDARSWGHESESQEEEEEEEREGDAVSIDNVELREVPVAPRRLNLNHGFMRFIVRNQHDRKVFEASQTERTQQRYSEAKDQFCPVHGINSEEQIKSGSPKVKRKQKNREKHPPKVPDPPRERVEVKKRSGYAPYTPPHQRTS